MNVEYDIPVLRLATALAATIVMAASTASAGRPSPVTVYNDRSTFQAAVGVVTVETFGQAPHFWLDTNVLNSMTSDVVTYGPPITPGDVYPGVNYTVPFEANQMSYFGIDWTLPSVGGFSGGLLDDLAIGERVPLTVTFDQDETAFGFDTNKDMSSFTVIIYSGSTQLYSGNFTATSLVPVFFGFKSDAANITSVVIQGTTTNIYDFAIDNFTYAGDFGVPEPAAWVMMLIGVGLTGGLLRRRASAA